jgi:hypothetical protein
VSYPTVTTKQRTNAYAKRMAVTRAKDAAKRIEAEIGKRKSLIQYTKELSCK